MLFKNKIIKSAIFVGYTKTASYQPIKIKLAREWSGKLNFNTKPIVEEKVGWFTPAKDSLVMSDITEAFSEVGCKNFSHS